MSFEFTPVDKTVRPPELVRAQQKTELKRLLRMKARQKTHGELAVEREAELLRELKGKRNCIAAKRGGAPVSIKLIIVATAQHYGIPVDALTGRSRVLGVVEARHVSFYLARKITKRSLPNIGMTMQRDHSTIINGIRKVDEMIKAGDAKMIKALAAIEEAIEP